MSSQYLPLNLFLLVIDILEPLYICVY